MKRHEEALNCFSNLCHIHPQYQDAFFHKGIELAELDRHNEAIEIFDRLLSKHKDNVNVLYAKSRSEAALDHPEEAFELLKKAIAKDSKTIKSWAKKEKMFEKFFDDERFRKLVGL